MRQLKSGLVPFVNWLKAMLLLHVRPIARWASIRSVERFDKNHSNVHRSGAMVMLCLWENDGRMQWLGHAAIEEDVHVVWIPRGVMSIVFGYLLRGYNQDATLGEANLSLYYHPKLEAPRRRFRRFCKVFVESVVEYYGAKALIVPKLNDDWIIDFNMAARQTGLPVVANDRESIITPQRMEVYPPMLEEIIDDLIVDKVALNNNFHQEFWRRSGYPEDRLVLTGKPDSDYWRRSAAWRSLDDMAGRSLKDKKVILYFSFGERNYLNFYYGDEPRTWKSLNDETHDALVQVLTENPDVFLIYKIGGKMARDYYTGFDNFVARLKESGRDGNLIQMNARYNSWDLVRQCNVIVGFQTSGLIEAMFTEKPIIYCGWGGFFDDIKDTLLPLHDCGCVLHADSPQRLHDILQRTLNSPEEFQVGAPEAKARKEFREAYFYQPDGDASGRILRLAKQQVAEREGWPERDLDAA